uniref:Uncharacterized protein n=1 Tax=Helianthus annuus TaxID=4232 RepID=A0A251UYI6_HELAN
MFLTCQLLTNGMQNPNFLVMKANVIFMGHTFTLQCISKGIEVELICLFKKYDVFWFLVNV